MYPIPLSSIFRTLRASATVPHRDALNSAIWPDRQTLMLCHTASVIQMLLQHLLWIAVFVSYIVYSSKCTSITLGLDNLVWLCCMNEVYYIQGHAACRSEIRQYVSASICTSLMG